MRPWRRYYGDKIKDSIKFSKTSFNLISQALSGPEPSTCNKRPFHSLVCFCHQWVRNLAKLSRPHLHLGPQTQLSEPFSALTHSPLRQQHFLSSRPASRLNTNSINVLSFMWRACVDRARNKNLCNSTVCLLKGPTFAFSERAFSSAALGFTSIC